MNLSRVLGNASANVAKVFVSALAAILLPRILLYSLSVGEYSVWVLIVQIGLYSSYLDIGISTVVGRLVAYYTEIGDLEGRDRTVSSGLALMSVFTVVAILGVVVAVLNIGLLFPQIDAGLRAIAAPTLLMVGIGLALRLPFNIISAIFIGVQRNAYPLLFLIVNKVSVLVFVFVASLMQVGLFGIGVAFTLSNVAMFVVGIIALARFPMAIDVSIAKVHWEKTRTILTNSVAFAVWSFSGLLIGGLDLIIVGAFDFGSVAAFSFAVTLTSLMTQIQSAAIGVIMPVAAVLTGRQDERRLSMLLIGATRYGVLLLHLFGLPLITGATLIIAIWVGNAYVASTVPLLIALVIGTLIRQSSLSFTMIVVGIGRQNRILISPLAGGLINLVVSIWATVQFGAIGAAIGTIVGGVIEVGLHIYYNLPRIPELKVTPNHFLVAGFLEPTLFALPGIVMTALWLMLGQPAAHPWATAGVTASVGVVVGLAGWFLVFSDEDRLRLVGVVRRIQMRASSSATASS